MAEWEAPAKLNLDLRVAPPAASGRHPVRSLVQTIEWCDHLEIEVGDEDRLEIVGDTVGEIPEGGDNLIWKAVEALGVEGRPRFYVRIGKQVPPAAGLGGGSSDAAAMLSAVDDLLGVPDGKVLEAAARVGSDVPLFLTGGTVVVEGYGERVTPVTALAGFAVAVAVPRFELATGDVYQHWDRLDGPVGEEVGGISLPPGLRAEGPLRNDLTPAAQASRPELADWMIDLAGRWERTVMMSGSGPACFAFFLDEEEAAAAAAEVADHRGAVGVALRRLGVSPRER